MSGDVAMKELTPPRQKGADDDGWRPGRTRADHRADQCHRNKHGPHDFVLKQEYAFHPIYKTIIEACTLCGKHRWTRERVAP